MMECFVSIWENLTNNSPKTKFKTSALTFSKNN
jgi:hypothetical protein